MSIVMKKYHSLFAILLIIFLINTHGAIAQWKQIGGIFRGEIDCFVENRPNLFIGSDGGGVFYSTDNGGNWDLAPNEGLTNKHVHALLISGANLLAATDAGIFLSINSANHWNP